jgi:hypothetical protein
VIKHSNKGWFGDDYAKRWNQAAASYVDIRIAGKVRRVADGTWHAADGSLDFLSTQERERKLEGWWGWRHLLCPIAFYERPFLGFVLLWLMAGLDAPLRDFWFFAADAATCDEGPALSHTAGLAREISEIETTFTLETWTPGEAKERNRAKRPPPRQPGFLTAHEELELARRGKAGDMPARDEIIARHWPLVERKCRLGSETGHAVRRLCG